MSTSLLREAELFAEQLTSLLGQTVGRDYGFDVVKMKAERVRIGPGPFSAVDTGFQRIALPRRMDPADQPDRVSLKIEFTASLDDVETSHLTIEKSTFGLWVRPDPSRAPRPVVRIEYDRNARKKPAAHVHIHAESVELGWLYGTAGLPLPRMAEIHFPVGGRRFRPTVEEFLLFLDREGLFTDWANQQWRSTIEHSLQGWDARQARATVRRYPDAAAEELTRLGYRITKQSS